MKITQSRNKNPVSDTRALHRATDSIGYHGGSRFQSLPNHDNVKFDYTPPSETENKQKKEDKYSSQNNEKSEKSDE